MLNIAQKPVAMGTSQDGFSQKMKAQKAGVKKIFGLDRMTEDRCSQGDNWSVSDREDYNIPKLERIPQEDGEDLDLD